VPYSTWGDAVKLYNDLLEKSSPLPIPRRDVPENYWRAVKLLQDNSPGAVAYRTYGILRAPTELVRNWDQWYPHSSDFWWYAKNFALYRNSLGAIEPWHKRLKAAVVETLEERKNEAEDAMREVSWLWHLWEWRLPVAVGAIGLIAYSKFGPRIRRRSGS
jgi:hypothetical protein